MKKFTQEELDNYVKKLRTFNEEEYENWKKELYEAAMKAYEKREIYNIDKVYDRYINLVELFEELMQEQKNKESKC